MEEKNEFMKGCLTLVGMIFGIWLICKFFTGLGCVYASMCEDESPYCVNDEDNYYHKSECPYIREDNFGEAFDSKAEAISQGYTACPHCFYSKE